MNKHLDKARKVKDDEFYTRKEDLAFLSDYEPFLKGRQIVCPADTEKSEFVKYFGKRCTYYTDIFRKPDPDTVIITNPPFSILGEYLKYLKEWANEYILIAPVTVISLKCAFDLIKDGRLYVHPKRLSKFNRPDGSVKNVTSYVISSFPVSSKRPFPDERNSFDTDYGPMIDRMKDFDKTKSLILCPITCFEFDLTGYEPIRLIRPVIEGKAKFMRILLRKVKE